MQDQKQNQDQNRKSGLQQDSMNTDTQQWQQNTGDDSGNSQGTEVDYPQQPRREEEPIVGGQKNRGGQTNRTQEGGMGNEQGRMSNDESLQGPMGNRRPGLNEGGQKEQKGTDQNQGSRKPESDDYRRNEIGNKDRE